MSSYVCLSVCVHDNSKNNGSIHLKLENIVVCKRLGRVRHWALSDQGQGQSRCGDLEIFVYLPQYKLSSPISQLWYMLGNCDYVCQLII